MSAKRVLIADDHPLVRAALETAIAAHDPRLQIETASTVADAEAQLRDGSGHVLVLLDYLMPDSDGFSGFFRLQHVAGRTPIAIISAHDQPAIVTAARAVGAAGFLSKAQPLDEIVASIAKLLEGKLVFPPTSALPPEIDEMKKRLEMLSSAQRRVLSALVSGQLNKQIAADLEITEATVKAHLTAIFRKLKVNNRLQAILSAKPLLAPEQPE